MVDQSTAKLEDLVDECREKGITPTGSGPKGKIRKIDCEKALQDYNLSLMKAEEETSPGLFLIHRLIESPQLAEPETTFSPAEFKDFLSRRDVAGSEKWDGARIMAVYHPGAGLEFFSRNRSVSNHLFGRYENQWYGLQKEYTKDIHPKSFIIDGELISLNPTVNGHVQTASILQAVVAMMGMNQAESYRMQQEAGYPLRLKCFDAIWYDGQSLINTPFSERLKFLHEIIESLHSHAEKHNLPQLTWIEETPFRRGGYEEKRGFFDEVVSRGGEGLILRVDSGLYRGVEARGGKSGAVAIKMKRSVRQSLGNDVDAFLGDTFEPGTGKYEGLIGSVDFYVYLQPSGERHKIASVSGLPDDVRRELSYRSSGGELIVNPSWVNRVAVIDGQDISSRSRAFSHARITRWRPPYGVDGKSPQDCTFQESVLNALIL